MANTVNLDIAHLQAAQAQKEVTANDAFDVLDAAAGDVSVAIANGTNNLTEAQARHMLIVLTGALTAVASVVVPAAVLRTIGFVNRTTGGFTVTAKHSGHTGKAVPTGDTPTWVWPTI